MSLDTPSITWRHLQGKVHAWTTSFGTKQSWSNSCMMFMLRMKKAMISRLGLFIVKIGHLTSKKCDIYATSTTSTISRDLTPQCYFFSFLEIEAVMVNFSLSYCFSYKNTLPFLFCFLVSHGRVSNFSQFLDTLPRTQKRFKKIKVVGSNPYL